MFDSAQIRSCRNLRRPGYAKILVVSVELPRGSSIGERASKEAITDVQAHKQKRNKELRLRYYGSGLVSRDVD
jgi:hypothetical protein